jgi:hypothetical protein
MEIPSIPSTEPASPTGQGQKAFPDTRNPVEQWKAYETKERQKNLGSLLKTAKQDVTVPEFDMNAFF